MEKAKRGICPSCNRPYKDTQGFLSETEPKELRKQLEMEELDEEFINLDKLKENMGIQEVPVATNSKELVEKLKEIPEGSAIIFDEREEPKKKSVLASFLSLFGNICFITSFILIALLFSDLERAREMDLSLKIFEVFLLFITIIGSMILMWVGRKR
jgi:hypothetical protein